MAAPQINQLPPPPLRNDAPADFAQKADVFVAALPQFVTDANTQASFTDQRAADADASAAAAVTSEVNAVNASNAAVAAANFKGTWSSLTGALSIPASVEHNGKVWILKNDLADVTASEPGVSTDWVAAAAVEVQDLLPSGATQGQIVQFDGLQWSPAALPPGVQSDYQEFTVSGTWTKPAGATWVYVECIGGGASGQHSTSYAYGGGGGGFSNALSLAVNLPDSVDVTVGAGGAGSYSNSYGNPGGDSSFGTFVVAKGGGSDSSFGVYNGGGGELSGNSTVMTANGGYSSGGGGYRSGHGGSCVKGGAGGGGSGGAGGVSQFGGNGGAGAVDADAQNGQWPGGGGGGCDATTAYRSGDGADGLVRVWAW